MKKILIILSIITACINGWGQTRSATPGTAPRANQFFVPEDGNLSVRNSLLVPRFTDTTQANTYTILDTLGRIIYTYDVQSFWGRQWVSGSKRWVVLGSGGGGGSGTLTDFSIVTANGFSGSVATSTTTPALTITTTITGLLKGNGTAISAAVAGTDYLTPTGSAALLTSFPTLNQNTTGTAGGLSANIAESQVTNLVSDLALKAPLVSPTFTGTVTFPTPFTLGAVSVLPTGTELNFVDGVTSGIQGQLDGKQATITFGTGVLTALGVNVGSAGAFVTFNGAGGTPSSMTGTNISGTASGLSIGGNAATATIFQTARNIQGVSFNGSAAIDIINGTGFVKATGTTISYDNSTYLTTASAASTYQPLDADLTTVATIGTALQQLRINAGGTAIEYFTPAAAGNTIYTGDGTITNVDRTMTLSGTARFFISDGATSLLTIDPAGATSQITSFNSTDGGSYSYGQFSAQATESNFLIATNFNAETKSAYIQGHTDATTATIDSWADVHEWYVGVDEYLVINIDSINIGLPGLNGISYEADTHQFTGAVRLNALAGNGVGVVAVDNDGDLSWLATPGGGGLTIGTTTITSGTTTRVLFNNAGVVGEYTISGTGSVAMTASPTFTGTLTMATPFTLGATSVTSTGPQLNYLSAATGTTGTTSSNLVFSATTTFTGTTTIATLSVSGFSTLAGGLATNTTAGNSNLYATGGVTANRSTTASLLPLSAAGIGARVFINGTTAYTMTANDAFGAVVHGTTGGVTEASSGTHPIVASVIVRPITVTGAAGATDILAGVYIEGPATGVTAATASYGLWVDAGTTRLDGGILGTATNDAATAGNVGEEVVGIQSTYTNYTTTATYQNITSITLTAGDWDISSFMTYSSNSATITAASNAIFVISTTTASAAGAVEGRNIAYVPQAALLGTSLFSESISPYRVSISGSTTYYLNSQATFTLGNPQFVGGIRARRAR